MYRRGGRGTPMKCWRLACWQSIETAASGTSPAAARDGRLVSVARMKNAPRRAVRRFLSAAMLFSSEGPAAVIATTAPRQAGRGGESPAAWARAAASMLRMMLPNQRSPKCACTE
jgi:hypothetical protein